MLEIRPVRADDDRALQAWHATYLASVIHGRTYATPYMLEEIRAEIAPGNPGELTEVFAGVADGEVVVTGQISLPLMDNTTMAFIDVQTRPDVRGRGHGSAMLDHLTALARQHARTVLVVELVYPYDAPSDGSGEANVDFATRRGFTLAISDVQRVLDLPADEQLLQRLVDEAAPHHTDYAMRQFRGRVPDDIRASFGELIGALAVEAPMGELELEPEVFDEARMAADEAKFEASGRTKYTTVAVARDGTVAAYSELVVPKHDPGRVYQWGTLALPAHRGHRLGLATKARNLLWLQRERPDLRILSTYNADVNAHMIEVNERMGFRPVERLGEFQKKLD